MLNRRCSCCPSEQNKCQQRALFCILVKSLPIQSFVILIGKMEETDGSALLTFEIFLGDELNLCFVIYSRVVRW